MIVSEPPQNGSVGVVPSLANVSHSGKVIAMSLWTALGEASASATHLEPGVARTLQHDEAKFSTYLQSRYLRNAPTLVRRARDVFPEWTPMVFHDSSVPASGLAAIRQAGATLVDMDHSAIADPRLWRFLAADDASVSAYMIRDIDSQFSAREVCAVREWIASNRSFHVMRDHPGHAWPMMAGMWGGRQRLRGLTQLLLSSRRSFHTDQLLLKEHVWPLVLNDTLQHDAHHCHSYPGAIGFPSRRVGDGHVGATGCAPGSLWLHTIFVESAEAMRTREYCWTLRANAEHACVARISVLTTHAHLATRCELTALHRAKLKVVLLAESQRDGLTYQRLLLQAQATIHELDARAYAAAVVDSEPSLSQVPRAVARGNLSAAATALQVVLHADILVGRWPLIPPDCLERMRKQRVGFALSRKEPEGDSCLTPGNAAYSKRATMRYRSFNLSAGLCHERAVAAISQDVLVFNSPFPEHAFSSGLTFHGPTAFAGWFNFHPNQLGAENLLACRLAGVGLRVKNVCDDLPVIHNHCSEVRRYASTARIDSHSWSKNALNQSCRFWRTNKQSLSGTCEWLREREHDPLV